MLQKAIDLGYVKVTIDAPVESVKEMEDQLKQTFHLKEVFVSPNLVDDEEINLRDTCRASTICEAPVLLADFATPPFS